MDGNDEKYLNELKKSAELDNSELEKQMDVNIEKAGVARQFAFLEKFRDSQLLLPVSFSPKMFDEIENKKVGETGTFSDDIGFSINYLTDAEGNRVVPLFTSEDKMREADLMSSTMVIHMEDLAEMLRQTDKYKTVAVNPFLESNINMPVEFFFSLFITEEQKKALEAMDVILKLLKERSVELEENTMYVVRSDVPFMKNDAVDGIFRPDIPFNVSSNPEFHKEKKYTNIILMPKGKKRLYIGDMVDETAYDVVIAPQSEFHHVGDEDEFTSVWKCDAQPFYDELNDD